MACLILGDGIQHPPHCASTRFVAASRASTTAAAASACGRNAWDWPPKKWVHYISADPSNEQGERVRGKVSFRHCRFGAGTSLLRGILLWTAKPSVTGLLVPVPLVTRLRWHWTPLACWRHFLCLSRTCLLGLKLSLFSGSESDVRDWGLWPARTHETFSWALFRHFGAFPKVHNKTSQDLHWPAGASSFG